MDTNVIGEDDVIMRLAGVAPGGAAYRALLGRADIMAMTREAAAAALLPQDPGGLSHAERAALAVRVARLHDDAGLAGYYETLMVKAGAEGPVGALADPAFKGGHDARRAALIAYADLVSLAPKDTVAGDIGALKAAGIADADIVRLAELTAFLAYQIRVIAGLRLMQATA
ncbi:MAG: CMD domain-containing protein [Kiloniellaceae bacterium]